MHVQLTEPTNLGIIWLLYLQRAILQWNQLQLLQVEMKGLHKLQYLMSCELRSCSSAFPSQRKSLGWGCSFLSPFLARKQWKTLEASSKTRGLTNLNNHWCWLALKHFLINVNHSFRGIQLQKAQLLSFVMTHAVSFCVFLIGGAYILPPAVSKRPPASQLLSGQEWATRAQSDIQDLPEGLLLSPGDKPGKTGQTSMPLSPELCGTFILMDLNNRKCSGPEGLSCWRGEERWEGGGGCGRGCRGRNDDMCECLLMELIKPQACPHSGSQRWAELRGEEAVSQSQRAAGQEAERSRVTLRYVYKYLVKFYSHIASNSRNAGDRRKTKALALLWWGRSFRNVWLRRLLMHFTCLSNQAPARPIVRLHLGALVSRSKLHISRSPFCGRQGRFLVQA